MKQDTHQITAYHWLMFLICFFGTVFAGTISTLMSVYLPVAVNDLIGESNEDEINRISAYINAIFVFGGAFGGVFAGWLSDRSGRKPAVIFSIACCGLFTILTGFMTEWWEVVACRFMTGFGLGAILVTTTTIMMEEWPQPSRAIFMGILSISIPVGIFSAGLIDYFVSSWRQAFLVGFLPMIFSIAAFFILRESEQWKLRAATQGSQQGRPGTTTMQRGDLLKGSLIFGTMLIGLWAIFSWLPTWIQTLVVSGDGQNERGMSMMMLGIGGLLGGFVSGWVINAAGAKKSMLVCFAACAVGSFFLFRTNDTFSPVIYAEILLIAISFGVSQGVLSVYIPNLFPVDIRGTATGICFNTGRFLTATAVLFVGVLVTELGGYSNALFLFSLVFTIGFIVVLFARDQVQLSGENTTNETIHPEVVVAERTNETIHPDVVVPKTTNGIYQKK
ncbi:MAG: MFS transporter [Chitinophagaceae bacterium]|nr:MAG: MFS transporter [Chitinophagaceae bacterium]